MLQQPLAEILSQNLPCVLQMGSTPMGTLCGSPTGSGMFGSGGQSAQLGGQQLYTNSNGSDGKMRSLTSQEAFNVLRVSADHAASH